VIDEQGFWARSTEQHCHYDGQAFSGPPAAVPCRFDAARGSWQTRGCFCSWSCARSWLEREPLREGERRRRLEQLHELASRYFGLTEIFPALPLEALDLYGGPMQLEEWRGAAHSRSSTVLYEPPLEPLDMLVLERFHDWEIRRVRHEFYHGKTLEERRQKEQQRQQKIDSDMKAATDREAQRLRQDARKKSTLFHSMNIELIE
jgi:hypothetical protein